MDDKTIKAKILRLLDERRGWVSLAEIKADQPDVPHGDIVSALAGLVSDRLVNQAGGAGAEAYKLTRR